MVGYPDSAATLGVIPCAITWLYRAINEQKQKTGARFSVRVSAVEITAVSQQVKDLLTDYASGEYKNFRMFARKISRSHVNRKCDGNFNTTYIVRPKNTSLSAL